MPASGIAVYVQDLAAFGAERARRLDTRLRVEAGSRLEAVYALVWPDYAPPATPHPQHNRSLFAAWRQQAPGVPLWGWLNAQPDQAADVRALARLSGELGPAGWLLDVEGEWTKGAKLGTLLAGAASTNRPLRASLAGATPSHVEYDWRALDRFGVQVDWQAYFDSGEGTRPEDAVKELYRSSFVISGWEYRHHLDGRYGWGKVGKVTDGVAHLDSYMHPGADNAVFEVAASPSWGWTVRSGELYRGELQAGLLMGRAAYANIRVALDVTRGAGARRSLAGWTEVAGSARVPGSAKRPVSVYLAEQTTDEVLVAIGKGAA